MFSIIKLKWFKLWIRKESILFSRDGKARVKRYVMSVPKMRSSYKVLSIKLSHAANDPLSDIAMDRPRNWQSSVYVGEPCDVSCLYQMGEGRACRRYTLRSSCTHYDVACVYVYVNLQRAQTTYATRVCTHTRLVQNRNAAKLQNVASILTIKRTFQEISLRHRIRGILFRVRFQTLDYAGKRREKRGQKFQ